MKIYLPLVRLVQQNLIVHFDRELMKMLMIQTKKRKIDEIKNNSQF